LADGCFDALGVEVAHDVYTESSFFYTIDASLRRKGNGAMTVNRQLAPIVVFVYNRPRHTQMTLTSLAQNHLAAESDLVVYSDGPKSSKDLIKIEEVRECVSAATGFKSVTLIERAVNLGLARSIVSGVSEQIEKYGRVIILEDDMITSSYFLRYMNDALEFYREEEKVISVHGYIYPVACTLPETFFLRGADCWGWATWRRGWKIFEKDGQKLLSDLKRRKLETDFDLNGAYPYTKMLRDQIAGHNDSWAIRWHASAFLQDKLTLYPGRSLVHNIGNDASGTHCRNSSQLDVPLSSTQILIKNIPVEQSEAALHEIGGFLRQATKQERFAQRGLRVLRSLFWGRP
jgi:hypothetical protein